MRLVALLLGTLAVCAVGLVFSVFGYARHGTAAPASRLAPSVEPSAPPAGFNPAASPSPPLSEPAVATPPPLSAGLADAAAGGSGPIALAPQEQPPASLQQDEAPPPAVDGHPKKDHGPGHGRRDSGGGGGD
jgi:hypothetical protein